MNELARRRERERKKSTFHKKGTDDPEVFLN